MKGIYLPNKVNYASYNYTPCNSTWICLWCLVTLQSFNLYTTAPFWQITKSRVFYISQSLRSVLSRHTVTRLINYHLTIRTYSVQRHLNPLLRLPELKPLKAIKGHWIYVFCTLNWCRSNLMYKMRKWSTSSHQFGLNWKNNTFIFNQKSYLLNITMR